MISVQIKKRLGDFALDVGFEAPRGVTAIFGRSGSGKTSVINAIAGLMRPDAGRIVVDGRDLTAVPVHKRNLGVVFQDARLFPHMTVASNIAYGLRRAGMQGAELDARVDSLIKLVRLDGLASRKPHKLSGGQRQRVAIARALILNPEIVVCDEPTSALDVSVQAQILNLLLNLREEMGLTYLLITHDMAVVEHISTRVVVMYLGRVVEIADTRKLFSNPKHPYTRALLKSVLTPEAGAGVPSVDLGTAYPNPIKPPTGCTFHPRCEFASDICKSKAPSLQDLSPGHSSACHMMERGTV